VPRVQAVRTLPTCLGHQIDDRIHALERDRRAMVSGMARLTAALRRLFTRRPRTRCWPARPSDDGGLEVVVEFCCRSASCRSRSAIRFSCSASCLRSRSFSCFSRSISCAWRSGTSRERSPGGTRFFRPGVINQSVQN
jgi:hypothetical protein